MKGRIMRIENGKFYVITENGDFVSAKALDGFECGDEIEVKNEIIPSYMIKPIASIAAAAVIVIGGIYGYHIPVRYVDICINPEIQLSLNALDRVISVQGKNDDGEKIADTSRLKNESVSDAIDDIVESARELGYMDSDNGGERDVIVSVFGNGADKLSKKIPVDNVRIVDKEDCENAKKADIPVGKYVLINELSKADESQSVDTAKNMSVRQIIDKINNIDKRQKPTSMPGAENVQTEPEKTSEPVLKEESKSTEKPLAKIIHKPTMEPTARPSGSKSKAASVQTKAPSDDTSKPKNEDKKQTEQVGGTLQQPSDKPTVSIPVERPSAAIIPSFDKTARPPQNTDGEKSDINKPDGANENKTVNDKNGKDNAASSPLGGAQNSAPSQSGEQKSDENVNKSPSKADVQSKPNDGAPVTAENGGAPKAPENSGTSKVPESGGAEKQPIGGNDKNTPPQNSSQNAPSEKSDHKAPSNNSEPAAPTEKETHSTPTENSRPAANPSVPTKKNKSDASLQSSSENKGAQRPSSESGADKTPSRPANTAPKASPSKSGEQSAPTGGGSAPSGGKNTPSETRPSGTPSDKGGNGGRENASEPHRSEPNGDK